MYLANSFSIAKNESYVYQIDVYIREHEVSHLTKDLITIRNVSGYYFNKLAQQIETSSAVPFEKSSSHHFSTNPLRFSVDPSDKKYPGLITDAGIGR